jgi:GT2 family glycosyltransferase
VEPLVSVVVVTWNGLRHLRRSLPAVLEQVVDGGLELIVVDNASADGTREYLADLARQDERVRVVSNERNNGFAGPNNQGFAAARGQFVATLNNDTVPQPGWLNALVEAATAEATIGSVASLLVFAHRPDTINSAGIVIDRAGIAWDRLVGRPVEASEAQSTPIFGASGGAALFRKQMVDQLGGFDDRFFMYLEDVDLAWRAQLAGWEAVYAPNAVVHHAHSGSAGEGSPFKNWHLGRNKVWSIAKCYPSPGLQRYLPLIAGYDLASLPYTMVTKRDLSPLRGRIAALRGLGPILEERRRLHARYPGGWERTAHWMQPVDSPIKTFGRYQRLRETLAGQPK